MDKLDEGKNGLELRKPLETWSQTFPLKNYL